MVVVKLKEEGQPHHKIIKVTGHARESSLDDYDEITEDKRRQLSHTASGYVAPKSSSSSVNIVQACTSMSTASSSMESPQLATLPECLTKENIHLGFHLSTCQLNLWQWRENISRKRRYKCSTSVCSTSVCSTMRFKILQGQRRVIIDCYSD